MFFRCEVLRLLLVLLIDPSSQNMSPNLASILDKYTWDIDGTSGVEQAVPYLSEELFILLQSVVMAFQAEDASSMLTLEDHLGPHLNSKARQLLRKIVKLSEKKCN